LVRDKQTRIEKEKAAYQKVQDKEVQNILELKSRVEAGASNVQAEYNKLESKQKKKLDQIGDFDEQLKENSQKIEVLRNTEYLKQELSDKPELLPQFKFTDTDNENSRDEEIEDNSREGGPLFTLDYLRKALRQEEIGTVVAWRPAGRNQKVVISCYSLQNTRKYRLQKAADTDSSWQEDKVDIYTKKSLRFGAIKDNKNKFIYRGSEAKGIVAVAWYFNNDDKEPEKLMLPKTQPKPIPGTRQAPLYRIPVYSSVGNQ
jgi:hypothetical protein